MKLLLVVLYLLLASATAALLRAVALVVAMALSILGGLCRRRRLSHLGDVERLPRAELIGGDVIALLELLDTDPVLLSDGVERLTCGDDVGRRRSVLPGLLGLSATSAAANGLLFFGGSCLLVAGGLASCHGAGGSRVAWPFEVHTQLG